MKARKLIPSGNIIEVALNPGEGFQTYRNTADAEGPLTFTIVKDPPNDMYDEFAELVSNGSVTVDPYTPPPELPKYFVSKAEMWRRCTEEEAEMLYADLRNAPARYQAIFDGASVIDVRDEFFPILRAVVLNRVTEERADELLAPTY